MPPCTAFIGLDIPTNGSTVSHQQRISPSESSFSITLIGDSEHVHSVHHRLYVPYSWGASYNHIFDSVITDGFSYGLGCGLAGLTTRISIILFGYGSFKNVFDHCGYQFPWNPISWITGTDPDFHDVHHQSWGLKVSPRHENVARLGD